MRMNDYQRKTRNAARGLVAFLLLTISVIFCGSKVQAAGRPVSINCQIAGGNVHCTLTASSVPASDDGKYYIYADEVFQDGPTGRIVASVDTGASVTAVFPLNYNTAESNLSC